MEANSRLAWFKSRTGTRLFRTRSTCDCPVCQKVYEVGIVAEDELHATYLYDMECDMGLRYFETVEEKDEWETKNKT